MPSARAQLVRYNGLTYYSAIVDGKQLLDASFVRRRRENPRTGFQRTLSSKRCRDIARYLDSGELVVPTNIIVSAQPDSELSYTRSRLTWTGNERSFLVLDGQHRLFAMQYTQESYPLTVAIFVGLTQAQEVQLFIDINTKQKGVPTALLLDIKQLAGTESSEEEDLRRIFDHVSTDRSSPLKGLTSPAEAKRGLLSRVTFNTAMKPALNGTYLPRLGPDKQNALIVNYLKAADRILTMSGTKKNGLTNGTTLTGFLQLLDDVVALTLEGSGKLHASDLTVTMEPLADLNFDEYVGSNRPSRAKLVADMKALVIPEPKITDDML